MLSNLQREFCTNLDIEIWHLQQERWLAFLKYTHNVNYQNVKFINCDIFYTKSCSTLFICIYAICTALKSLILTLFLNKLVKTEC